MSSLASSNRAQASRPQGMAACSTTGESIRSDSAMNAKGGVPPGFGLPRRSGLLSVQDERKQVWIRLQSLRRSYLNEMIELYGMLTARSNQPMAAEQLQKLKHYKDVLHRMIPYLRVPQDRVPKEFNIEKVDAFEKQIFNIMETFKRRRQGAAQ